MRRLLAAVRHTLHRAWGVLRAISGDSAYETYLAHARPAGPVLTREEFYLDSLRRRYSRVSRCC